MTYPMIGDIITPQGGLALCRHFGISVINFPQNETLGFRFDGVSFFDDDQKLADLLGVSFYNLVYQAALPHDLRYAYGIESRHQADRVFRKDLKRIGVGPVERRIFYWAVRLFGAGRVLKTEYTWKFARYPM